MVEAVSDHGPGGSAKWGDAARAGFQVVPDALLAKQHALKLDPTDIVVLLNITMFWWYKDEPPFLRTNVIAQRMNVTTRTVQRSLKKLEGKGYIQRKEYDDGKGNIFPAVYFHGLTDALVSLSKNDPVLSERFNRSALPLEFAGGDEIPF